MGDKSFGDNERRVIQRVINDWFANKSLFTAKLLTARSDFTPQQCFPITLKVIEMCYML